MKEKELELYFHIPFCVKKCLYCDFLSAPAGEAEKKDYMEALLAETAGSAVSYKDRQVASVFIGGGTPSAVPAEEIERLMESVAGHYRLKADAEVTVEVNPGTISGEGLRRYKRAGINRLSMGLQSARNDELARLGRIHTWEQFRELYGAAREAGFSNINVDIMSALPGQTLPQYRETLDAVLSLEEPPEHISAYSLILEEGTPFFEMQQRKLLELPDEDTDRLMYQETKEVLSRKGYRRYEISNYAREGYACRHNCGYWQRKDYVGFGIGAASLLDNVRFRNGRELQEYVKNPMGCREECHVLTLEEQMEEFMFLGLRMTDGVSRRAFEDLFGWEMDQVYGDVLCKNISRGLLEERGGRGIPRRIALTDKGLDLSNYVMAQFLLEKKDIV